MADEERKHFGVYCQSSGRIALLDSNEVCSGEVAVSGDGMNGAQDKYGEHYVRLCLNGCGRRRVKRKPGQIAVSGCE